jgi:hypothetical protein
VKTANAACKHVLVVPSNPNSSAAASSLFLINLSHNPATKRVEASTKNALVRKVKTACSQLIYQLLGLNHVFSVRYMADSRQAAQEIELVNSVFTVCLFSLDDCFQDSRDWPN